MSLSHFLLILLFSLGSFGQSWSTQTVIECTSNDLQSYNSVKINYVKRMSSFYTITLGNTLSPRWSFETFISKPYWNGTSVVALYQSQSDGMDIKFIFIPASGNSFVSVNSKKKPSINTPPQGRKDMICKLLAPELIEK